MVFIVFYFRIYSSAHCRDEHDVEAGNDLFVGQVVVVVDDGGRLTTEVHLLLVQLSPRGWDPAVGCVCVELATSTLGGLALTPAPTRAPCADAAAAQLDVDEPKHVGHHITDHRDAHEHDGNADHGVDEHCHPSPRRLRRNVAVTCSIQQRTNSSRRW